MNSKALLIGLASIVYLFGANWFYSNNHKAECCPAVKTDREPLMFNWSNPTTLISDTKFPGFKSNILKGNTNGSVLEITGKYFEGETTPEGYTNMGLARAESIWKEQFSDIPKSSVSFLAEKVAETDGVRTTEFESAAFNWRDPLTFNWSSPKTLISDTNFPAFKSYILNGNKEGKILEITGRYFEGETAPEGFADMGMARAEAIWNERFSDVPATRIKFKSEKVPLRNGVKTNEFAAATFNWMNAPTKTRKVIETANTALIYFNFNGTQGKLDQEVTDYLKKVAERLKNGTEKIRITGHTDNVGEENANNALGMRRSKTVRDILVRYGVNASRISTFSKGETAPEESNDTDAGRALNRRAFIEIVK